MPAAHVSKAPTRVAVLAFAETTASVLCGMHDFFAAAGRDWGVIEHGTPGPTLMASRIVSVDGAPLRIANGVCIQPDGCLDDMASPAASRACGCSRSAW